MEYRGRRKARKRVGGRSLENKNERKVKEEEGRLGEGGGSSEEKKSNKKVDVSEKKDEKRRGKVMGRQKE